MPEICTSGTCLISFTLQLSVCKSCHSSRLDMASSHCLVLNVLKSTRGSWNDLWNEKTFQQGLFLSFSCFTSQCQQGFWLVKFGVLLSTLRLALLKVRADKKRWWWQHRAGCIPYENSLIKEGIDLTYGEDDNESRTSQLDTSKLIRPAWAAGCWPKGAQALDGAAEWTTHCHGWWGASATRGDFLLLSLAIILIKM